MYSTIEKQKLEIFMSSKQTERIPRHNSLKILFFLYRYSRLLIKMNNCHHHPPRWKLLGEEASQATVAARKEGKADDIV